MELKKIFLILATSYFLYSIFGSYQKPKVCTIKHYEKFVPKDKYSFNSYTVKTSDGYILTLFGVSNKIKFDSSLHPIYIQHGLGGSPAEYLNNSEGRSVALLLADKGYQVFLGASRGNYFSDRHESKQNDSKEFWDFSYDDLKYDIEAFLLTIKELTKKEKIHYIGHSQGAVAILATLSDSEKEPRDTIAQLTDKIILFAPVVYSVISTLILERSSSFYYLCWLCCRSRKDFLGLYRIL